MPGFGEGPDFPVIPVGGHHEAEQQAIVFTRNNLERWGPCLGRTGPALCPTDSLGFEARGDRIGRLRPDRVALPTYGCKGVLGLMDSLRGGRRLARFSLGVVTSCQYAAIRIVNSSLISVNDRKKVVPVTIYALLILIIR